MTARMEKLAHEIVRLQAELDREIEHRRKALGWAVKGRRRGSLRSSARCAPASPISLPDPPSDPWFQRRSSIR